MKFRDIKQFTEDGTYAVDVPIWFLKKNIEDYKETYGLEMCPDFQRGNVWTKEQQIAYLEFFYKGGKTSRTIYFNDPNFGRGTKPDCDIPNMVLVDGLQRLTAHLDFLDNKIPIFGHYFSEFEDKPDFTRHTLRFNVNDLQYRREVLQWYLDMNSGGVVHSQSELDRVQGLLEQELQKQPEKSGKDKTVNKER